MKRQLGWLAAAAGLGFAIPAVFAGLVGLERDVYLLVCLLARNPVAQGLAHVAMDVAAVVHGMEVAVQLPPHG